MVTINGLTKVIQNTEYKPYDTNLPDIFNEIQTIIHKEFPDIRIEHFGSSSVPGIDPAPVRPTP